MSAWLALTDATVENGCLHIAPGSHELGYLSHELEAEHGQRRGRADQAVLAEAWFGHGDAVPVPVAAGDAVRTRDGSAPGTPIDMAMNNG